MRRLCFECQRTTKRNSRYQNTTSSSRKIVIFTHRSFSFFFVQISFFNRDISQDAISLGFIEIGLELDPIESSLELPAKSLDDSKNANTSPNSSSSSIDNLKRTPRIIGKRGKRNTEFIHPSSLAYSKQDQLICNEKLFKKNLIFS